MITDKEIEVLINDYGFIHAKNNDYVKVLAFDNMKIILRNMDDKNLNKFWFLLYINRNENLLNYDCTFEDVLNLIKIIR